MLNIPATLSIPAIEDFDPAQARLALYQGGRLVHGPFPDNLTTLAEVTASPTLATRAAAEAFAPATAPDFINIAGNAASGDDGAALYSKVAALPPYGGLTTANGFYYKNTSKDFTPEMFASSGGDDSARISDWLAAAAYEGRDAVMVGEKLYNIGAEVFINLERPLTIRGSMGAVIKGLAGPGCVLSFDGGTARPTFKAFGLNIDTSVRDYVVSAQSGTSLELVNVGRWEVANSRFYAGEDYRNQKGDSAVTLVMCDGGWFHHNYVQGMPDLGFYGSGGPAVGEGDNYGDVVVSDNTFDRCDAAFAAKRQTPRYIFARNHVLQNRYGIFQLNMTDEVGGQFLRSGENLKIHDNYFWRTALSIFEGEDLRYVEFNDNTIIDWGQYLDGTGSGFRTAVRMFGVRDSQFNDNIVVMKDWANTPTHIAFDVRQTIDPIDSVVNQSTGNSIGRNMIRNTTTGIQERDSATANDYPDNIFNSAVTNRIVYAPGSTSKATATTTTGAREAQFSKVSIGIYQSDKVSLTKMFRKIDTPVIGTVNADARNVVTISIPGVLATDTVQVNPHNSTTSLLAIEWYYRCTTDGVVVEARNRTASAVTVPDVPHTFLVTRSE
jgi:hypothetical protein